MFNLNAYVLSKSRFNSFIKSTTVLKTTWLKSFLQISRNQDGSSRTKTLSSPKFLYLYIPIPRVEGCCTIGALFWFWRLFMLIQILLGPPAIWGGAWVGACSSNQVNPQRPRHHLMKSQTRKQLQKTDLITALLLFPNLRVTWIMPPMLKRATMDATAMPPYLIIILQLLIIHSFISSILVATPFQTWSHGPGVFLPSAPFCPLSSRVFLARSAKTERWL